VPITAPGRKHTIARVRWIQKYAGRVTGVVPGEAAAILPEILDERDPGHPVPDTEPRHHLPHRQVTAHSVWEKSGRRSSPPSPSLAPQTNPNQRSDLHKQNMEQVMILP
jgi:hypothetical protein